MGCLFHVNNMIKCNCNRLSYRENRHSPVFFYFVQQSLLEKQKEFVEKLEEVCDNLTSTENHLIGHQQQAENTESVTDLQQYQEEHQV